MKENNKKTVLDEHQLRLHYIILKNTKDREVRICPLFLTEVDLQNRIMIFQPSIKILYETIYGN